MGAWGCGTLENDAALDFLLSVEEDADPTPGVRIVLDSGSEPDDSDDEFECEAVAAAELLAAAFGRPNPKLTDEAKATAARLNPARLPKLAEQAVEILRRIRFSGPLFERWADTDELDAWVAEVDDLVTRLTN